MNITDIQSKLPPGVRIVFNNGHIAYSVRTSRQGKKYSLGTFSDPVKAIDALQRFKYGLFVDASAEALSLKASSKEEHYQKCKLLLDDVPMHTLDSSKPCMYLADDGTVINIAADIVARYIHEKFYIDNL